MAKFDTDEIGKPGRPPKHRPFPWRLWLFAIVMTAGAAAGGYYTWQFRRQATTASDEASTCLSSLGKQQAKADDANKKAIDCVTVFDGATRKNKELETQLAALSTNLDASKDELAALRAQRAEAEKRLAAIDDIQKQFAKMIDTGQLKVIARRGSLVLSLPSEVLFPSGVAELSKPGELAVLEVGITLKRFPDRRFLVVGHTDDVPLKSATYKDNWELSTARALTVTRFLVQAGMDPKNLVAAGAGENDPVSKERAKNRRIEIALLPAINELPPLPASLGADTAAKEVPRAEAPKAEAPKPEAPKPEAPKPEAPKPEPARPAPRP
ncbi:MAG TPA: OmpA family protein [Kofleriaceae bacterium]|nr:OmpA family protein [Kofleriaceae bacterium]